MKHKIADLEGALLDAAVAKVEGFRLFLANDMVLIDSVHHRDIDGFEPDEMSDLYSTFWGAGGPLIERERIAIFPHYSQWAAYASLGDEVTFDTALVDVSGSDADGFGPTPLIAAMRAYVASKFGEDVELP